MTLTSSICSLLLHFNPSEYLSVRLNFFTLTAFTRQQDVSAKSNYKNINENNPEQNKGALNKTMSIAFDANFVKAKERKVI